MAWNGGSGVALVHPRLTNRGRAAINRILRTAGWKEEQFWVCRPDDVPVEARALVAMGDEAQTKQPNSQTKTPDQNPKHTTQTSKNHILTDKQPEKPKNHNPQRNPTKTDKAKTLF